MYAPDTIVAPATPPGRGAVAIVRISGPRALEILKRIWRPIRPSGAALQPRRLYLGEVRDPERKTAIDQAMAVVMPAPASFTGEDVAELHCHGGAFLVRRVVGLAIAAGARLAEPGEFTRRAFLNGRIDLTAAEAIADLIDARGDAALDLALAQLSGTLARKVRELREQVVHIRASLEASIDFAEEDVELPTTSVLQRQIAECRAAIDEMIESFRRGQAARDGLRVTLVGRPNVGKSSLLNLLLGVEKAIVTPIPGTTRDVLEDTIQVGGYPILIQDTAGIGPSDDPVEQIGIERSHRSVLQADIVLAVFDSASELTPEDREVVALCQGRRAIGLLNKADLEPAIGATQIQALGFDAPLFEISALTGKGLERLLSALLEMIERMECGSRGAEVAISRERHRAALARSREALLEADKALAQGMPPEIVAVEVEAASQALGELTGDISSEDVLDAIFREFCIGK